MLRFSTVDQQKGGMEVYERQRPPIVACVVYTYIVGAIKLCGGLRDMKIFKATQSGFEGDHVQYNIYIYVNV